MPQIGILRPCDFPIPNIAVLTAAAGYIASTAVYHVYFHPLSQFPGPKSWAISRLPFVQAMHRGDLVRRITEIHEQYGSTVRVAPNELSFTDPAAGRDIYAARPGQPKSPKNPIWMGEPIPRGNSIIAANDADHSRIRRVWAHAFTDRALKEQEPVLQGYVGKFIAKLRMQGDGAALDIVQWINFLTFDLTGDLAFGESFECLEGVALHPWISMIFSQFKSATLLASIRFYPSLHALLIWSLPASVLQKQQDHFQMSRDKVQRRLNLEKPRRDFLQHVMEHQGSGDEGGLTEAEIEKTAATMIVAGSETTGTLLAGILNHLIRSPDVMSHLVNEIRSAYSDEEEMTPASLNRLVFLGAVIQEGLRIAPPVPTGMPRVVPSGGASVCGVWLPENVSRFVRWAGPSSIRT